MHQSTLGDVDSHLLHEEARIAPINAVQTPVTITCVCRQPIIKGESCFRSDQFIIATPFATFHPRAAYNDGTMASKQDPAPVYRGLLRSQQRLQQLETQSRERREKDSNKTAEPAPVYRGLLGQQQRLRELTKVENITPERQEVRKSDQMARQKGVNQVDLDKQARDLDAFEKSVERRYWGLS